MNDSKKLLIGGLVALALVALLVIPRLGQKDTGKTGTSEEVTIEETKPVDEIEATLNPTDLDAQEENVDESEIALTQNDLESGKAYLTVYDENQY